MPKMEWTMPISNGAIKKIAIWTKSALFNILLLAPRRRKAAYFSIKGAKNAAAKTDIPAWKPKLLILLGKQSEHGLNHKELVQLLPYDFSKLIWLYPLNPSDRIMNGLSKLK